MRSKNNQDYSFIFFLSFMLQGMKGETNSKYMGFYISDAKRRHNSKVLRQMKGKILAHSKRSLTVSPVKKTSDSE